jgi:LysM repeat protein
VKLRSTSRRIPRQRSGPGGTMMEADPEPEMRLSRALLVMLLMHIVVIGGIVAFSLIKERNPAQAGGSGVIEAEDSHLSSMGGAARKGEAETLPTNIHVVRSGETLTRIANENGVSLEALVAANSALNMSSGLHTGQQLNVPATHAAPAAATPRPSGPARDALELIEGPAAAGSGTAAGETVRNAHLPADSGKIYIVGKGETPISIAHKLKVSYDALLKLNGIDDPKKLKPGQKLRVPAPAKLASRH